MALSERIEYDQYQIVTQWRHIQVRKATVIEKDGVEVTRTFHRYVLTPNMDISAEPADIQEMAKLFWTDAIKASWATELERQMND